MARENPGFEVVGGTETEPAPQPQATSTQVLMLTMALKALSQRALIAAMDLFTLITCTLAWVLWYLTPSPTDRQIASLAIYAVFTLAANWIVRGRK